MKRPRKGHCYQDAFYLLGQLQAEGQTDWVLCHGVVIGTGPLNNAKPCGHAWLESPQQHPHVVFDGPTQQPLSKAVYYEVGQIDPAKVLRWTRSEAIEMLLQRATYGPWNPAIVEAEAWLKQRKEATT